MPTISWDGVTAWRMKRSHLARRRSKGKLVEVASTMCGAHAQILSTVALALHARVTGLRTEDVDSAINHDHSLVKTWSMRGTLHVLPADDLPLYCAALSTPEMTDFSWLEILGLKPSDLEAVLDAIPIALDGRILTREELADAVVQITKKRYLHEHLRSGWGSLLKPAAVRGLLCFGPPEGRSVTFTRPDQWIGGWKRYEGEDAIAEVFSRFLSTYGPASKAEMARWFGAPPVFAGRVLDSMGDQIVPVTIGGAKRLVLGSDLRSLQNAGPATGARLLPSFDQLLVMSAPHSEAIVDPKFKARVYRQRVAVWSLPSVMINGRARGGWKLDRKRKHTEISIDPFIPLTKSEKREVEDEVERLGAFLETSIQFRVAAS